MIAVFVICGLLLLFTGAFCINYYVLMRGTRKYVQIEMNRAQSRREYRYWKREMKKLCWAAIPGAGLVFRGVHIR